jgi:aminoglycoside phosphotransferase (APT) family kinase protein
VREPGALLATGREADVFEYGPQQVLRRSREGHSQLGEARAMAYLFAKGYPVPEVVEVDADGRDLVMERIDGPTMVDAIARAPWTVGRRARELASLHQRLHEIQAPDFLRVAPVGRGDAVVHLDLHPLNVMIGPNGPVVIDWSNVARGDPAVDVVTAWVLMTTGQIHVGGLQASLVGVMRGVLVRSFLARFDRPELAGRLEEVVTWKADDPHMSDTEIAAMWRLSRAEGH